MSGNREVAYVRPTKLKIQKKATSRNWSNPSGRTVIMASSSRNQYLNMSGLKGDQLGSPPEVVAKLGVLCWS